MSREDVLDDARGTVENWKKYPGLIRKMYVLPDSTTAMGIYLWKTLEDARAGHDADWLTKAEKRWGNRPEIEYLDTLMVLDNRHNEVIESPGSDM